MKALLAAALLLALCATAARAEVVDVGPAGFQVRHSVEVSATPMQTYYALSRVGQWWSSEHSWGGNAARLSIETKAGGCWCEALPNGGSTTHMTVIVASPGETLRFAGALGPLSTTGASGHMTWRIDPRVGGGSKVTWTYDVGGYAMGGLAAWAKPVDGVLGQMIERFRDYAEARKSAP